MKDELDSAASQWSGNQTRLRENLRFRGNRLNVLQELQVIWEKKKQTLVLEERSPVHLLFTSCSPPLHLLFTSSSPPVHLLFTSCSPPLHLLFTSCSPLTSCSPPLHLLFTSCSPPVTSCSPPVHLLFTSSSLCHLLFTSCHLLHLLFTSCTSCSPPVLCSPPVHLLHSCSPPVHLLCTSCSPPAPPEDSSSSHGFSPCTPDLKLKGCCLSVSQLSLDPGLNVTHHVHVSSDFGPERRRVENKSLLCFFNLERSVCAAAQRGRFCRNSVKSELQLTYNTFNTFNSPPPAGITNISTCSWSLHHQSVKVKNAGDQMFLCLSGTRHIWLVPH
ncbi:unnamed protein product [Pleuronectes platessa]|uniref:Uncharacterized protein n=1 Tax=Pleuronectes platessa TaxID=8262 RepID=A0A9N7YQB7_PLEPL|nr:unnamed protein product [Pleuronectes platessa]